MKASERETIPDGLFRARVTDHKRPATCDRCGSVARRYAPYGGKRYCEECVTIAWRISRGMKT